MKFAKLNTVAQQREAVTRGRSLLPYRLRYKNLVLLKCGNCNHKGDEGTQRLFVVSFVRLFRLCGKKMFGLNLWFLEATNIPQPTWTTGFVRIEGMILSFPCGVRFVGVYGFIVSCKYFFLVYFPPSCYWVKKGYHCAEWVEVGG
ncbi:MAG: hypothetical protein LBK06_05525 [Planctomycetaceae bacterium]|nr:hypothetical protein [Planctomycetaceae bacterium]